jgi:tripartite-type tricarboxylate transporter receptor subunit TctC
MKRARRRFLQLATGSAALPALSRMAWPQAYPSRVVRLISGFAPGDPPDVFGRFAVQWLSEDLGQRFIVENRVGAAGNLATEAVVRAPADGHTLLMINPTHTINVTLFDNLRFDFVRDIVPVASIARGPGVIVVAPTFPAKSVPELIAYAKANPGRINVGAPTATPPHIYGELFKMMAGIDMVHVPYRGMPQVLTDLLGGQVQVAFDPLVDALEQVKAGRLRALAVTSSTRAPSLPEVPAIAEFLPGYEASAWHGIAAARNTPATIVEKLNSAINARLADPKVQAQIASTGYDPFPSSSAEFARFVAAETEKWAKVIRVANVRSD